MKQGAAASSLVCLRHVVPCFTSTPVDACRPGTPCPPRTWHQQLFFVLVLICSRLILHPCSLVPQPNVPARHHALQPVLHGSAARGRGAEGAQGERRGCAASRAQRRQQQV